MSAFTARLACLVAGHKRVMAAMRLADGRFLPVAMCNRCGASLA
jgi:hypothetical protein